MIAFSTGKSPRPHPLSIVSKKLLKRVSLKAKFLKFMRGLVMSSAIFCAFPTPYYSAYAHHAQNFSQTHQNNQEEKLPHNAMIGEVLVSALNFMLPRSLEPYSAKQLCLWGLNGLSMLDSSFSLTQISQDTPDPTHKQPAASLALLYHQEPLLVRSMPDENDLKSWAALTLRIFQTAWAQSPILRENGEDALLPTFFNELFNHLDPYSRYLPPQDAHHEREDRQGDSFSVGITLQHKPNSPPIISAINVNSPAWDQGVDIGQTLLRVNQHSTENAPLHLIYRWLYGKPNSFVTLSFKNAGGEIFTCRLRRQPLPPETVFAKHIDHYLLLKITHFSTQTAEEVSQYISSELPPPQSDSDDSLDSPPSTEKLPGIILDLRGNHGGVLQQAVITAALFLNNGLAATTEGRLPASNHIWAVQGGDITNNSPIIVLVDGQTASAAEILAAALADRQRAVIIGSSTLGKGLVQIIGQMPNGGELFITWSRNIAPLGEPLQNLGVMPQICTSAGTNYLNDQLQALKKGHSLQKDLLHQSRQMRDPLKIEQVLKVRQHCPASLGTENDISTALNLLHNPMSYETALHSVMDDDNHIAISP